mmetsp:Transcript_5225/g.9081  ORF Transcript_5225/g.9081 Transcript_5225/m.9081 type:complete len:85 (+) Transcript_5225:832-1086(+)
MWNGSDGPRVREPTPSGSAVDRVARIVSRSTQTVVSGGFGIDMVSLAGRGRCGGRLCGYGRMATGQIATTSRREDDEEGGGEQS